MCIVAVRNDADYMVYLRVGIISYICWIGSRMRNGSWDNDGYNLLPLNPRTKTLFFFGEEQ